MAGEDGRMRPVQFAGGNGHSDTLIDWLLDLRLDGLWPNFEANG